MIIGIDFDGTCTTHDFPRIGKDIGAQKILKKLINNGHQLILFTMRSDVENPISSSDEISSLPGKYLTEAVSWFKNNNIPLYGIQTNPNQHTWTTSPKAYCHLYLDDAALGCPLKTNNNISSRPFVDWDKAEEMLINMEALK